MSDKVIITADSAADLPPRLRGAIGLQIIPIHIILEGRTFLDGADILPQDIYDAFRARKSVPKTAAPSPEAFKAFFEGFTRQGHEVVHISLNHKYSSCCRNAVLGAGEAEGEVRVVDSLNFCVSQGLLCLQAHRLRGEGLGAAAIAEELARLREKICGVYYLDTLDFIAKSGRCPGAVALGANLLSLHPAVQFDGATGGQTIGKKYRGKSAQAAEAWLRDTAARFLEECGLRWCMFAHTPEIPASVLEPMYRLAKELLLPHVERLEFGGAGCVGCTTISHVGGGCFGLVGMER
jgi:DegV family protein with EDD domain